MSWHTSRFFFLHWSIWLVVFSNNEATSSNRCKVIADKFELLQRKKKKDHVHACVHFWRCGAAVYARAAHDRRPVLHFSPSVCPDRRYGVTARRSPSVVWTVTRTTPQLITHEEHDRVKGQGPEKATTPADHLVGASKHHTSPFLTQLTSSACSHHHHHYTTHYKHTTRKQQLELE